MSNIYTSPKFDLIYNAVTERAEILGQSQARISFALIKSPDKPNFWDKAKSYILTNFTWTWITVKDAQGNDTDQITNITSICNRVGLSREEIEAANNAGTLYRAIGQKLITKDLPNAVFLDQLMRQNTALLNIKGYVIDDTNETTFIQTLVTSYEKKSVLTDWLGIFFASFAIKHFGYVDLAEEWMNTTFDERFVSPNKLKPADISYFTKKGMGDSIKIHMKIALNNL